MLAPTLALGFNWIDIQQTLTSQKLPEFLSIDAPNIELISNCIIDGNLA